MKKAKSFAKLVASQILEATGLDLMAAASRPGDLLHHRPVVSSLSLRRAQRSYSESEKLSGSSSAGVGPGAGESESGAPKETGSICSSIATTRSGSVDLDYQEDPYSDEEEPEARYCSPTELSVLFENLDLSGEATYVTMSQTITTDSEVVLPGTQPAGGMSETAAQESGPAAGGGGRGPRSGGREPGRSGESGE